MGATELKRNLKASNSEVKPEVFMCKRTKQGLFYKWPFSPAYYMANNLGTEVIF